MTGVGRDAVLPAIGTKELVASLPMLLGLGPRQPGDGARAGLSRRTTSGPASSGAEVAGVRRHDRASGPGRVDLVWVNSPSNPTGRVLPVEHLRKMVTWARERGAVLVSDECYVELGWDAQPVSVLHPDVCGGSHDGVLALHSLSKRSNLAGYRAGFVAGDPALVRDLLEARKHLGLMMPTPVQAAMVAALDDDAHVVEQRTRYAATPAAAARGAARGRLHGRPLRSRALPVGDARRAVHGHRWRGSPSGGSWSRPVTSTASRGARHVRVALTASDERVDGGSGRAADRRRLATCTSVSA